VIIDQQYSQSHLRASLTEATYRILLRLVAEVSAPRSRVDGRS
jgi:hypothetical protein